MLAILLLLATFVADLFKSRRRLEAENLFLRHQLNIALRGAPPRLRLHGCDRALLVWITRVWPNLLDLSQVVKPETILRLASRRLQSFLALEIPPSGRAAEDRSRITRLHSADEQREPVVGRPAHPRRTTQTWLRGRRVDRLQIHDQTPRAAIADVADIPAQPCECDRGSRPLPSSDRYVYQQGRIRRACLKQGDTARLFVWLAKKKSSSNHHGSVRRRSGEREAGESLSGKLSWAEQWQRPRRKRR